MRWRLLSRSVGRYGFAAALFWAVVVGMQSARQDHRPFARIDPWYTGAPDSGQWVPLPEGHVLPTVRAMSAVCAEQLAAKSYLEIPYELARAVTGQALEDDPRLRPVLVRSVQLSRYQHVVTARQNEAGQLWLKAETVSRWALPMLPRPTVVMLARAPEEVFVDAEVHDSRAGS